MGLDFGVSKAELTTSVAGGSLDEFGEKANSLLTPETVADFIVIPQEWLEGAVPRLSVDEQDIMLRHKVIAYVWLPEVVVYGVVNDEALQWARGQGLSVVGRVALKDYRSLVLRKLGRRVLAKAVHHLSYRSPWASAKWRMTWPQVFVSIWSVLFLALSFLMLGFKAVWFGTSLVATVFFTVVVGLRCLCLMRLPRAVGVIAPLLKTKDLPVYTVLVPLFRETAVLPQLLHALSCLDYPEDKLDIKIILENSDKAMHRAVDDYNLPDHFDVVIVPSGKPQTKPRALNYAMQFARGELLAIYDSEDIPQPNQLRLAAAQLAASPENVACLQAALEFYNPNENWLTRHFTAEYAALFHAILPTLAAYKVPLLLGGTSNHFRVPALIAVGGWDPYNVTEDADLGIRLARFGYQTAVVHSSTYEEANPEIWNWLKQRRRWLKGFLQTWLVHNRNPLQLLQELKPAGFCVVQCMTLGIFLSSLLHPIFLLITAWNILLQQLHSTLQTPFETFMMGYSVFILITGYVSGILLSAKGLRCLRIRRWGHVLIGIPIYWLLMSVAAWMALWDFCVAPHHWHKTKHGLSRLPGKAR